MCPATGKVHVGATVDADDGLLGGEAETKDQVAKLLKPKYKVQVSDPVASLETRVASQEGAYCDGTWFLDHGLALLM